MSAVELLKTDKDGSDPLFKDGTVIKKDNYTETELRHIANRLRKDVLIMVSEASSGHPGGPLGLADIYTYLFFQHASINVEHPAEAERDRILLSNGHVCAIRYAAMARKGFLPAEELLSFRRLGSRLQGHPSTKFLPTVENSSGSLGQGLSNASGVALGLKLKKSSARVYVGMSDGECQEGMTWEAAMAASYYRLNNLTAFIDWNNIQIDGYVDKVMDVGALDEKFRSFGWQTKIADGHDFSQIAEAFKWADEGDGPRMILFKTVLGKGVSFMQNEPSWHGVPPKTDERDAGIAELEKIGAAIS